jgi:hypothetical protein
MMESCFVTARAKGRYALPAPAGYEDGRSRRAAGVWRCSVAAACTLSPTAPWKARNEARILERIARGKPTEDAEGARRDARGEEESWHSKVRGRVIVFVGAKKILASGPPGRSLLALYLAWRQEAANHHGETIV